MRSDMKPRDAKQGSVLKGHVFSLLLFLAVIYIFISGLVKTSASQSQESLRIAQENVVRAVITCYALEGSYPESFEYLKQNYSVQVDEERFAVHYEIFASNIMPDISVVERGGTE